ncbi:hypothetical protein V2J23_01805 [Geobacillus thermoleovorans]|uniref:hypothetical protein n=1 Tax=Geobacillus thermoleovorans TaxID=33941 RepID=UPI00345BA61A
MAEIEERFKTLRYFVDGYYNQSIDDDEFDDRIRDFFTCLWAIRVGQWIKTVSPQTIRSRGNGDR